MVNRRGSLLPGSGYVLLHIENPSDCDKNIRSRTHFTTTSQEEVKGYGKGVKNL